MVSVLVMARRKQIFVAPGEDKPLPIEKSAWHFDRRTYIPGEHWDKIIEFALIKMPEFGELLEEGSYIDRSEPLTPEITDEILETP